MRGHSVAPASGNIRPIDCAVSNPAMADSKDRLARKSGEQDTSHNCRVLEMRRRRDDWGFQDETNACKVSELPEGFQPTVCA